MASKRKSIIAMLLKNALVLVIVVWGGDVAYTVIMRERAMADRMNQAAAAVKAGDYPKAIHVYQSVLAALEPGKDDERIGRVNHNIARCQLALAEDTHLTIAESLRHYRAAEKISPGCVKDPLILKLIKQPDITKE